MENIQKFVKFLQTAGVSRTKLFVATDLYANKYMGKLMVALNDLAEALHDFRGYSGPTVREPWIRVVTSAHDRNCIEIGSVANVNSAHDRNIGSGVKWFAKKPSVDFKVLVL
jgi:hypothetical protein